MSDATRKTEILEAARDVFVRYGFKKTSMDDLARASGLSRQGLYLHFPSKEALFEAMVAHFLDAWLVAAREALGRDGVGIEERVLAAFDAVHGSTVGSETLDELVATSAKLVAPVVIRFEESLISEVARALSEAEATERWLVDGFSANALAEHLSAASVGIKHKAKSPAEYRERMRLAVHLVCQSSPK